MVEQSAVNRSVVGSSPMLGAIYGPLEKWLNSHAFHACTHGFESRTGHQEKSKARFSGKKRVFFIQNFSSVFPLFIFLFFMIYLNYLKGEKKMSVKDEVFTLYNGVQIPKIGLGTWQAKDGKECVDAVKWAIDAGYRHIDTAYAYGNEESVAKGIKESGRKREEIFITTKLPAHIKTYEGAREHFLSSLKSLHSDYIDLYLIHAPWPWQEIGKDCKEGNIAVWKAMVEFYQEGKIRSIGVSNFQKEDIEPLIEATQVVPMVNQIRFFIGNTQKKVYDYCKEKNILIEAYSPFATGEIIHHPVLEKMAEKYQVSPAKICLRYCLQKETLPLPKSVHENRIRENLDVDFLLSKEDMEYLDSLKEIGSYKRLRS